MSLKTFSGGVHPHDFKELARAVAIVEAPVPQLLTIPLSQHIGKPAQCLVKAGDAVKRGQLVGKADGFISAAIHSPVSGTVKKIGDCNTPLGAVVPALVIENDGQDTWADGCNADRDTAALTASDIRAAAQEAGLVGRGGATFPTHVKLSPPAEKPIDHVILNGVECEPYLTADYRLMLESPATVVEGLKLAMRAVNCAKGVIGIEANKPDAFEIMRKACAAASGPGCSLSAELLEVKYPQGAEKQLIGAITGREVPSGGFPMDVGCVVQNVATAHALYEACRYRRPLTERIVTITGDAVAKPGNWRARIGTPVSALLALAGFDAAAVRKLVFGGPMMGMAHFDPEMPVTKGTSGVVALRNPKSFDFGNCVRCGRCVDGCPQCLVPSELSILVQAGRFGDAKNADLMDCIECGVCTYICPARRPIVQWIKLAKLELRKEQARAQAAAKPAAPKA